MSIEASRRHGPFDPRRQKRRFRASPSRPGLEEGLDWNEFSSRYFSGRGRHDLHAVSAYDASSRSR